MALFPFSTKSEVFTFEIESPNAWYQNEGNIEDHDFYVTTFSN